MARQEYVDSPSVRFRIGCVLVEESRLREIELACNSLFLPLRYTGAVGDAHDGQRVAFIGLFGENVDCDKIEFERRRHVDRILKGA